MMWKHYVYVHKRADDGRVFYVGKGTKRRSMRIFERAHDHQGRSDWWKRVVAKHGFNVEIVAMFQTDELAQSYEQHLISEYGRHNLVNLTDGGDGCAGLVPSADTRRKLSVAASRPRSEAFKASIRAARKNGGNGGVVKKGDTLPDWWKARISAAVTGGNNHMFGRTGEQHPRSRRVIDSATGVVYPTVAAAAEAVGMKMKTLHNRLSGHRENTTTMRFE